MRRAVILQHLDREGPGFIADLCSARGLATDILRLDLGVRVPRTLDDGDLLVVMGGPMGVGELEDPRFPFLAPEVELLRAGLARQRPILGICLGAQLLAHAAGSRVYPNQRRDADGLLRPSPEVGFGEVRLLGLDAEPALAGLPARLPVLHWHGDTFALPVNAVRLAESDTCADQAFRLGFNAFGLQFHVETDAAMVRRWAEEDSAFATSALGAGGPAAIMAASEAAVARMRDPGMRLVDNILDAMTGTSQRR
ncbi:MAG: gamma-glutamyl-gamma-aminobutyrate hydrolase family protein [Deltaproteobacteria bacterium]|nr:gamma-glutamyl-gamma-aminobutyrate hydrolase family protein [Deltaproteobacteria bacterium]